MLERIAQIQGIGLLHQANGKPYTCQKATLIYADNGRGKSTLATIFRSASTGNASLITAFKTVDGTLQPKVVLQFGNGHKVSFENGAWSEQRTDLLVFDADFIGRNVHSGGTVNTDHRKNLLEFALGVAAVTARAAVAKATNESKAATDKVQSIVGQLSGFHPGLTLVQFEQLPKVSDIDAKITDLQMARPVAFGAPGGAEQNGLDRRLRTGASRAGIERLHRHRGLVNSQTGSAGQRQPQQGRAGCSGGPHCQRGPRERLLADRVHWWRRQRIRTGRRGDRAHSAVGPRVCRGEKTGGLDLCRQRGPRGHFDDARPPRR